MAEYFLLRLDNQMCALSGNSLVASKKLCKSLAYILSRFFLVYRIVLMFKLVLTIPVNLKISL